MSVLSLRASGHGRPVTVPPPLAADGWTVHQPRGPFSWADVREVLRSGELLAFLVWRDLTLKYREMMLGVLWVVVQPLLQMVVFSLLFGRFANLPSENQAPYSVLVFSALLPWQYFSVSFSRGVACLSSNQDLLKRIAFPRLVVPVATVIPALADFLISLLVLLGLMAWYGLPLRPEIVLVPVLLVPAMAAALLAGLWLAPLNVRFRDVQYLSGFLLQVGMLATPVAYSAQIVPHGVLRLAYELNPLTVVIQGMRWAVLGAPAPGAWAGVTLVLLAAAVVGGVWFFRKSESLVIDEV